jgi:hypothetical protein
MVNLAKLRLRMVKLRRASAICAWAAMRTGGYEHWMMTA